MTVAERLPRGKHGLTRDQVVRSQRGRIFRAMAQTMAEQGYAGTSIAQVLRAAGVSRETFYEQFSSKEDCFMGAFEAAVQVVLAGMSRAPATGRPGLERFEHGLRAYLDALAAEPVFARVLLIEVYAAGPEALRRRAALQKGFVDAVSEALGEGDRFAAEALVAAVSAMVTARLADGDIVGLRALHGPLVDLAHRLEVTR
jgi:AcrR family transcriptional regulator